MSQQPGDSSRRPSSFRRLTAVALILVILSVAGGLALWIRQVDPAQRFARAEARFA